jgi:hypothetical protein
MQVRMDQPAAFSLTGELHVGITPQQGNARLCGLQVTQGTLAQLYEERRKRSNKDKRKRKGSTSKHETKNEVETSFISNTSLIAVAVLSLTVGIVTSFDFGLSPLSDDRRLQKRNSGQVPTPSKPQAVSRLSAAEKKLLKEKEKSAALEARKLQHESKAVEIETETKREARAETPEERAKRLEREVKKRQRQDRAREESLRAEARAMAAAKVRCDRVRISCCTAACSCLILLSRVVYWPCRTLVN